VTGGLTIDAHFDTSVTHSAVATEYESAVDQAIANIDSAIATPITVTIDFGWGEIDGYSIEPGALGESLPNVEDYTYGEVYAAAEATLTNSAVQREALASLPTADPTGGGVLQLTQANALALGLLHRSHEVAGYVGLDSSSDYFWSETSPQAGSYDAVATFEHEITEVLGRSDDGGVDGNYSLLDFYRYTAIDLGTADAPGSAAGALDQPFVAGYSAANQAYFSPNGQTLALAYDTPADIADGADIADWSSNVVDDSFDGTATPGVVEAMSTTDLEELNVIGYQLVACYASGTRVATARGEVAVEELALGDRVVLAGGGFAPVTWLGHRRVECARHPRPESVWPLLVRAGAFAEGVPRHDLRLSPDHAVFADGVLIPIGCLVNGTTIAREACARVTYWHVALPRHGVILAEGLAAESYLDTGNRAAFDDGQVVQAHPDFAARAQAAWEAGACAAQVRHGAALEAVRVRLLVRAAAYSSFWACAGLVMPPCAPDQATGSSRKRRTSDSALSAK
jgi:hypothetical protein